MILEAKSRSCFSSDYLLQLDSDPYGTFRGRALSSEVNVQLRDRRLLRFEKQAWSGSRFVLTDQATGSILAEADRAGVFTSAWELTLSCGHGRLVSAGMFNSGFIVERAMQPAAEVNALGICDGGWQVRAADAMSATDLLFVGLTYSMILRRNAAVVAAAT